MNLGGHAINFASAVRRRREKIHPWSSRNPGASSARPAIPLHRRGAFPFRRAPLSPLAFSWSRVSSSNTAALDVPRDRTSHYFNSYGNHAAQRRYAGSPKTFGTMRGTMPQREREREGCVCRRRRRGTHRHTEVAAEGTGGCRAGATGGRGSAAGTAGRPGEVQGEARGRGTRWCECDIEFATPWRRACYRQCPTAGPEAICSLCDEIYESFQRSRYNW